MTTKTNNRMVDNSQVNVLDFGNDTLAFQNAWSSIPTGGALLVPVTGTDYVLDGTDDLSSIVSYSFGTVVFDVSSGSTAPTHTNLLA